MIGRGSATDPLLAVLLEISAMERDEGEVRRRPGRSLDDMQELGIGHGALGWAGHGGDGFMTLDDRASTNGASEDCSEELVPRTLDSDSDSRTAGKPVHAFSRVNSSLRSHDAAAAAAAAGALRPAGCLSSLLAPSGRLSRSKVRGGDRLV